MSPRPCREKPMVALVLAVPPERSLAARQFHRHGPMAAAVLVLR